MMMILKLVIDMGVGTVTNGKGHMEGSINVVVVDSCFEWLQRKWSQHCESHGQMLTGFKIGHFLKSSSSLLDMVF